MKKTLVVLLFALPFFTACKKEYARVQPAKAEFFAPKQRAKATTKEVTVNKVSHNTKRLITSPVDVMPTEKVATLEQPKRIGKATNQNVGKRIFFTKHKKEVVSNGNMPSFEVKNFPKQQLKKSFEKQLKKKKRKRRTRWNAMIPAGFVFLGIAILLALLNLNGLALLFGVASILFLFLGFKRLFRKKRRRSIFR